MIDVRRQSEMQMMQPAKLSGPRIPQSVLIGFGLIGYLVIWFGMIRVAAWIAESCDGSR
jgi:spore maturation protein SpmA